MNNKLVAASIVFLFLLFLVEMDVLVIFYSGGHRSTGEILNRIFKDNIDSWR